MEKWRRCKMFEHPQPLLICRCLCASTPVCALALWRLFIGDGDDLYIFYWQVFICASLTCYLLTHTQMYTHAHTALTWMNSTTIWTSTKKVFFNHKTFDDSSPGDCIFTHLQPSIWTKSSTWPLYNLEEFINSSLGPMSMASRAKMPAGLI